MKEDKNDAYLRIREQLAAMLGDCQDLGAAMATTAAMLKDGLEHVFWAGFYIPREDGSLMVGPYQGPPACMVLPAGRGVCGEALDKRATVIVPDVEAHEDHIACDPRSKSEIVVPVLDGEKIRAILDVDSNRLAAFDEVDQKHLEALAAVLAEL